MRPELAGAPFHKLQLLRFGGGLVYEVVINEILPFESGGGIPKIVQEHDDWDLCNGLVSKDEDGRTSALLDFVLTQAFDHDLHFAVHEIDCDVFEIL